MHSIRISAHAFCAAVLIAIFPATGVVAQESGTAAADPFAGERHIDPKAQQYMRAACEFLDSKPAFSVHGEGTVEQLFRNGRRIQRSRGMTIVLKRPDRLWADVESDKGHRRLHYDGKTLVINDVDDKVYGKIESNGTVETMLTDAQERFDVVLPLADLLYDDPCAALKTSVENGWYLGKSYFAGGRFHHILLSAPEVDLQVWVTDGKEPLFRKLVLTYKNEPGEPQYGVALTDWDFSPKIDETKFRFTPPADAREIQFVTYEAPVAGATEVQE